MNNYTQNDLKKMNIVPEEIEKIKEELGLLGLGLKCNNKKTYLIISSFRIDFNYIIITKRLVYN